MTAQIFSKTLHVPVPVEALFAWHERPGAFERLSPPWDKPRVLEHTGGIRDGAKVTLQVHAGPIPTTWTVEHRDYIANRQFRDVMTSGPFARWQHTHRFRPDGIAASTLEDHIEYALPLGAIGSAVGGGYAASTLARVFRYRHELLAADLARHAAYADRPRMRIAITGASGFIGTQLAAFLSTGGHDVVRIHLAGASIAERWTAQHRAAIRSSRIEGTSLLAHTLAQLTRKPQVLLSGSAIGIYGSRGDEVLDESSTHGTGYLADVCNAWEDATEPASRAGIRVVHLRTGIVQGAAGGALAVQLPLFRLGLGGQLASGAQWISPIALDDEIGAMYHCLMHDDVTGPVNLVAPSAFTNEAYTHVLAAVLHRPSLATVPAFALRLALGAEMADATALASQRVVPTVLQRSGFRFRLPEVTAMLRFELGV